MNRYLKSYSKKFYKTTEWIKKREEILKRDNYECQHCKLKGKVTNKKLTVHHIKHYRDEPSLALTDSNLITLCGACHNKEHPEKGFKKNNTRKIKPHAERWA